MRDKTYLEEAAIRLKTNRLHDALEFVILHLEKLSPPANPRPSPPQDWSPRWGEKCTGENVGNGETQAGDFEGFEPRGERQHALLKYWNKNACEWCWYVVKGESIRPSPPEPASEEGEKHG